MLGVCGYTHRCLFYYVHICVSGARERRINKCRNYYERMAQMAVARKKNRNILDARSCKRAPSLSLSRSFVRFIARSMLACDECNYYENSLIIKMKRAAHKTERIVNGQWYFAFNAF